MEERLPFLVFNVLFGMLSARTRHPSKAVQSLIKHFWGKFRFRG